MKDDKKSGKQSNQNNDQNAGKKNQQQQERSNNRGGNEPATRNAAPSRRDQTGSGQASAQSQMDDRSDFDSEQENLNEDDYDNDADDRDAATRQAGGQRAQRSDGLTRSDSTAGQSLNQGGIEDHGRSSRRNSDVNERDNRT